MLQLTALQRKTLEIYLKFRKSPPDFSTLLKLWISGNRYRLIALGALLLILRTYDTHPIIFLASVFWSDR